MPGRLQQLAVRVGCIVILLAIVAAAVWMTAARYYGFQMRAQNDAHVIQLERLRANLAEVQARQEKLARDEERAIADETARLSSQWRAKDRDAQINIQRRDAAIAAGGLRVRQRLTCPGAGPIGELPQAGTDTGRAGDGSPRGLEPADAAAALRIADEGDERARRLNRCIAQLRADRLAYQAWHAQLSASEAKQ